MTTQEYILTVRVKNLVEKRGLSLICERCGAKVEIGQRVLSRQTKRRRVHYHASCWESMFMDDDTELQSNLFQKTRGSVR